MKPEKYDIVLVKTPVPELQDDRLDPPMGLLYLATVLKRCRFKVKILDLSGIPKPEWRFPKADYYGFSTYTASYYRTNEIKDIVKSIYPRVKTIAGGPHASVKALDLAQAFDHVVIGEGENALLELLSGLNTDPIIRGRPMDINLIPPPDYSLVDIPSYTREYLGKPSFQVFSSRGCPYQCAYCSKLPGGQVVRRRKVGHVADEIRAIQERYGDVTFRFKDDLFATNRQWLQRFRDENLGIEYSCNVRADYKDGVPELLAETGCRTACLGIESGSDVILKAMNKGVTRQQNIDGIKGLQAAGIEVLAWIIIGYPGETWQTFYETISLLQEAKPNIVRAYPLIPYPGTEIYEKVQILDHDYSHYFYIHGNNEAGFVYQTAELPRGEIMGMWASLNRYLKKYRTRLEGS